MCLTFNVGDLHFIRPVHFILDPRYAGFTVITYGTIFRSVDTRKKNCPYLYWNSLVRQSLEASFLTTLPDIIENCLFILWRHLDFYFLHCIPSDEERRMLAGPTLSSSHMRRLQGTVGTL